MTDVDLAWNPSQPRWPKGSGKLSGQWRGKAISSSDFKLFGKEIGGKKKTPARAASSTPTVEGLDRTQAKQYKAALKAATKEARAKGKNPTKAQIGKHLPAGHPMKPTRRADRVAPLKRVRQGETFGRTLDQEPAAGSWEERENYRENPVISKKVKINGIPDAKRKRDIAKGLELIDRVHKDSDAQPLRTGSIRGRAHGRYGATDGQYDHLMIKANTDAPLVTVVHEMGHWLDMRVLGTQNRFNSEPDHNNEMYGEHLGPRIPGTPQQNAAIRAWHQAINASPEAERINRRAHWSAPSTAAEKRYAAYLGSDHEMWARSYAQYIAVKTGDREMLKEIDYLRSGDLSAGRWEDSQWSDKSFRPIFNAIEGVLKAQGLM